MNQGCEVKESNPGRQKEQGSRGGPRWNGDYGVFQERGRERRRMREREEKAEDEGEGGREGEKERVSEGGREREEGGGPGVLPYERNSPEARCALAHSLTAE